MNISYYSIRSPFYQCKYSKTITIDNVVLFLDNNLIIYGLSSSDMRKGGVRGDWGLLEPKRHTRPALGGSRGKPFGLSPVPPVGRSRVGANVRAQRGKKAKQKPPDWVVSVLAPPAGLVQKKGVGGTFFQTVSPKVRVLKCGCAARTKRHTAATGLRRSEPATTYINTPT